MNDIKLFWGWKWALEEAGIDYYEIKVELLDYAVCEICGIERNSLSRHLARIHGVDMSIGSQSATFWRKMSRAE